jgi:oligoribonuclease
VTDAHPPLIWLDLEMSGLDPDSCQILEIATIVTRADLEIVAAGPDLVIHHDDAVLEAMDEWNTSHHRDSGLTKEVKAASLSTQAAEEQTIAFLSEHCEPGKSPLCGNSIGRDRRFLLRHMPRLAEFVHYRNIDVSSIKEVVRRWYPDLGEFEKQGSHRAHGDIRESIGELRFYREQVFR